MDFIVIEGVHPWDGRYELDLQGRELTTREWGWIKRLSGYLPLTVEDGLADPELITVLAVIALRRAGKVDPQQVPRTFERLSDAPFGAAITMETDVEEAEVDAGPPVLSSNGNAGSSGPDSPSSSARSATPLRASGTPDWVISQSGPPTSER